jgi:tellurite resistance protein TerC
MSLHPGSPVLVLEDGEDLGVDIVTPTSSGDLLNITPLVWIITIAVTIAFFVYEFFAHVRKPHEPTIGESARWSAFYIGLALLFGVGIGTVSGWTYGGEYFAGYLTEKALSIDNLFVFLIVMTGFAVPRIYQQKVLMIGIVIALIMRGGFIALGATLIENFSWIFYLFGALLLFLAYRQAFAHGESDPANGRFMRFVRRVLPVSDEYNGDRLTVQRDGKRFFTPMFLVIIAIGFVDLIFAVDSIPAIYGLTEEAYIVFTANAFALMGLRQLYFLIGGLLQRLVYLAQGLAVILAFIGVKLVMHALHVNELPFINGGEPMLWVPEIPIWFSLVFIGATIAVATIASLMKTRRDDKRTALETEAAGALPGSSDADSTVTSASASASSSDTGTTHTQKEHS